MLTVQDEQTLAEEFYRTDERYNDLLAQHAALVNELAHMQGRYQVMHAKLVELTRRDSVNVTLRYELGRFLGFRVVVEGVRDNRNLK